VIEVVVPGSKSLTNRALVCATLADGTSTISGALVADDTAAMTDCLRALGAGISWDDTTVQVDGLRGAIAASGSVLDARLSGTTSRFVLPLLALGHGGNVLDGAPPLRRRPMHPALDALRALGAEVVELGEPGHLPVSVTGPVRAGAVRVRADVSSQFVSGLLLAAPAMPNGLRVELEGALVAAPFVAMTVAVMGAFGAIVDGLTVSPGRYGARDYRVEPDASAASYFYAAAAITGREVSVAGLDGPSLQGDLAFREVIARMGSPLRGIDVDLGDMPDMAQTFAVLAAVAEGPSRVRGVGVIRGHETDRIAAVVHELRRVGVGAHETDDGFVVEPAPLRAARVETYDDHRMAMAFALLTLVEPGIEIDRPEVVAKTFPGFWDALATVRP
jgi:3-phosphoshikimate 1-carboxyvinyltransferase